MCSLSCSNVLYYFTLFGTHRETVFLVDGWGVPSQPSIITILRSDQLVLLVRSQGQDPTDSFLNLYLLWRWIFNQLKWGRIGKFFSIKSCFNWWPWNCAKYLEAYRTTQGYRHYDFCWDTYCEKMPNSHCKENCSTTTAMTATTMVRKTKRLGFNLLLKVSKLSVWNRMQIFIYSTRRSTYPLHHWKHCWS